MVTTEPELLLASRAGDRAAFAELVERCAPMVEGIAYARTRDRTASEDIAQDTFVTAWRELHRLRDASALRPWLCGIARNLASKARRTRSREVALPEALVDERTPFHALCDEEMQKLLAASLEHVPALYREALVLFYYEQQSTKEVAVALGVSEDVVHKRLSRGREALAETVLNRVENQLAKRRTRRSIVAGVLAALPVAGAMTSATAHAGVSSLTASASNVTTSSSSTAPMSNEIGRRGLVWTLAAVIATGAIAIAWSSSDAASPAATAATDPISSARSSHGQLASSSSVSIVPSTSAARAASVAPRSASPRAPSSSLSTPATTTSTSATTAAASPTMRAPRDTCASIAKHFVDVSMSRFESAAIDRAELVELEIERVEEDCRDEKWSRAQLACMAAATDEVALHACRPAPKRPVYVPAPAPVAADVDVSCAIVGTHVAELMIDSLEGTDGDNVAARVLVPTDDLPRQVREDCVRSKWSDPLRRCFAAATKFDQIVACKRA